MPTQVMPIKLTPAEVELLDWLVESLRADSRSQALRKALLDQCFLRDAPEKVLNRAVDERANHPPRRAVEFTRLIGPRNKKRDGPGLSA